MTEFDISTTLACVAGVEVFLGVVMALYWAPSALARDSACGRSLPFWEPSRAVLLIERADLPGFATTLVIPGLLVSARCFVLKACDDFWAEGRSTTAHCRCPRPR